MTPLAALRDFLKQNSVIADGAATLAVKIASAGFSYLMFLLIANALTPVEYGYFGIGFAIAITLGNIAALGTSTSLLRFLPQYNSSGRPDLAKGYLKATSGSVAIFACIVAAGIAAVGAAVYQRHGIGPAGHLFAAAAFTAVITFTDYLSHALRALGKVLLSQIPKDVIWRIIVCAFAGVCVFFGWTQTGASMLVFSMAALIVVTAVQLVLARKPLHAAVSGIDAAYEKPVWVRTMLPIWGVVSLVVLIQQFDVVVVGLLGDPAQSGAYFAALRTASLLSLLLLAGNLAAAPLMSALFHTEDRAALKRTVRLISAGIGVPTLAGLALMAVLGRWLLSLFDPSFAAVYPVLMVLSCGFAADAIAGPTAYLLQMTGHERTYLKILGTCYGLTLVSQLILIPIYGLMGAAIPSACGMALAAVLGVVATRKLLNVDPSIFGAFRHK